MSKDSCEAADSAQTQPCERRGRTVGYRPLLSPVPAIGAELVLVNAHGLDHVIQSVLVQGGKIQLLPDPRHHVVVLVGIWIHIFLQIELHSLLLHVV